MTQYWLFRNFCFYLSKYSSDMQIDFSWLRPSQNNYFYYTSRLNFSTPFVLFNRNNVNCDNKKSNCIQSCWAAHIIILLLIYSLTNRIENLEIMSERAHACVLTYTYIYIRKLSTIQLVIAHSDMPIIVVQ